MSFLWTPGDKGLTLVSIYLTFYFCYLQRRWIINHILDKRQKISSLNWRQAKAIICSANEPVLYNKLWNYYLTINFLKGLLHITIFSKIQNYLLQLKNIFRIFWNYFWNILETSVFQNKNQGLCKKCGCFLKMAVLDNNQPMGLLTFAGGSLLLSQEHIKEKRKQRRIFG